VCDAVAAARLGIPSVALVTDDFWAQGDFVARSTGMPEVPRIRLPHPVAGTGAESHRRIAEALVPRILAALEAGGESAAGGATEGPGEGARQ